MDFNRSNLYVGRVCKSRRVIFRRFFIVISLFVIRVLYFEDLSDFSIRNFYYERMEKIIFHLKINVLIVSPISRIARFNFDIIV